VGLIPTQPVNIPCRRKPVYPEKTYGPEGHGFDWLKLWPTHKRVMCKAVWASTRRTFKTRFLPRSWSIQTFCLVDNMICGCSIDSRTNCLVCETFNFGLESTVHLYYKSTCITVYSVHKKYLHFYWSHFATIELLWNLCHNPCNPWTETYTLIKRERISFRIDSWERFSQAKEVFAT
jgi:hypothetical protein